METVYKFQFHGARAEVVVPENANDEWVWKTEFFHAFDSAEQALLEEGYTRVYYSVSDRYGSYKAVRLMKEFYRYVTEKFTLAAKAHLFGFSRGGLYAFNFTLFYPEAVASVYLDAPVLDLKSWPPKDSEEQRQLFREYTLNAETLPLFDENPVDKLDEYFGLHIPTLVVAGDSDELVPLSENAGILLTYCNENGISVENHIKKGCGHHPHSLDDVTPIVAFVKRNSAKRDDSKNGCRYAENFLKK